MKTYQYELPGYYGATDDTDDLVRWIAAPNKVIADSFALDQNWNGGEEIFDEAHTTEMLQLEGLGGIDVVLE